MTRTLFTLALVAALALPALAKNYTITDNHQEQTINLSAGDSVSVMGNHNKLTLTGSGGTVDLLGNHNHVTVNSSGTEINVAGNHNDIRHDGPGGTIDMMGNYNNVRVVKRSGRAEPEVSSLGKDCNITEE